MLIYHYTSQSGIIGICSNKALWASKIQYLNDHQEFVVGLENAKSALRNAILQGDAVTKRACEEAVERIDQVAGANIMVASFSEAGNLLSQWRAYSKGAVGYALGFELNRLHAIALDQGFRLLKCIYDEREQMQLMRNTVATILNIFEAHRSDPKFNYEDRRDELCMQLMGEVCSLAPFLKHNSFREEQEWRLVSGLRRLDRGRCGVRPGINFLVPYAEIPLNEGHDDLVFDEIIVGPSAEPERTADGVAALLATSNCSTRRLVGSGIPYRTS